MTICYSYIYDGWSIFCLKTSKGFEVFIRDGKQEYFYDGMSEKQVKKMIKEKEYEKAKK